ncbi:MAG: outer membrane lipoprotein-sorting protein, partial [Candidatus Cloacimonadota bacterium]|nr:outer membrane lipoprotein-sorting protein [Candidatus Cloacimonadota bacterium]
MKTIKILSVILIITFVIAFQIKLTAQEKLTALQIVENAINKVQGNTSQGTLNMTIIRPTWSREISMKIWSKGMEYYMIYISSPARDRGQVFLKREEEMWNWIPTISRMVKIPPSMMMQSWMGSDFTNNDLIKLSSFVKDYNHSLIGSEEIDSMACYKIKFEPKETAAVVWGKIVMWISKTEFYQLKIEYFDEYENLVNRELCSNIQQMGDRKLPGKLVMIPVLKKGNKTILEYEKMEFNKPLNENFFSIQNMKRV